MEGDCNNNTTINNESNKYEIRKNKGISDNISISGRHSFCGGNEARIEKVKNVENKEKDESDRMKQLFKIALPHICLYVILCLYLLVGAWAFARIEHRAERLEQSKRLLQISNIYEQITSSIDEECSSSFTQNPENSQKQFNSKLLREGIYSSLSRLSQFFEGPQFRLSASEEPVLDKILPPRWDPMSSTLYALSILTTTGYASATPMTPFGQWLSIGYGLLGIPLTVLAAVDIGRFLSDVVLAIYDRILRTFRRLRKLCCRIRRRRTGPVTLQNIETNVAFNTSSQPSLANRRRHKQLVVNALPNKNKQKSKTNESVKNEETKRRLPLSVNAAILLLFCMLGGWVYMAADGSGHNFIEGFFVTFNLVANLTMSEMPTHISYLMTLIYIFVFVFFGLAVLSMCADLAASELKWMFLKIHYFGRKINWAKRRANKRKQQQMEMEVKELLLLIDQIRAKYPDKEDISSLDILKYVQELNADGAFGGNWSHRTFSLWLLQHQRRNTLAFTPQSFEALKFADEMDQEEEQLLNSTVNALLINWRRQRKRGEQNTFIPLLPFGV